MDQISQIPLEQLHESPFNPRKTFTGIDELAASIKAEGRVLQPILVRPRLLSLRDGPDGFEVVFGHRRLRAAEAAGLESMPCMVKPMLDEEVKRAQIAENLQREDVHPIEEAWGFLALIDEHRMTADQLVERFGKSRSYVYGRLKLLQAVPEIRQACIAGEIGSEVALLIARLRTEPLQKRALAAIRDSSSQHSDLKDGGRKSFRFIRDLLAERFTLELRGSIFDREDATLVPEAGTCSACPKRTGNAPEFADLAAPTREGMHRSYTQAGGADVCTDPDCFAAKKKAHLAREAGHLRASGKVVVEGNAAKQAVDAQGNLKNGFVPLAKVRDLVKQAAKGAKPVVAVHVQDPRTGKVLQAVRQTDLVAAGVAKPEPKEQQGSTRRPSHYEIEQKKREAVAADERKVRLLLLDRVMDRVKARARSKDDLVMVVNTLVQQCEHGGGYDILEARRGDLQELLDKLPTMAADELCVLAVESILACDAVVNVWNPDASGETLKIAAKDYGLDVDAIRAEALPPPPTAARAPTAAAGKAGSVKYADGAGSTWSGKGMQPAWVKAALANGKTLADLEVKTPPPAARAAKKATATGGKGKAAAAAKTEHEEQMDDDGSAVERDTKTSDMFGTAEG